MTVVRICQLCQHSNKYGSKVCASCGHELDAPIEAAREELQQRLRRAVRALATLLVLDVALLVVLPWVGILLVVWIVAFALAGGFTMRAARRLQLWRYYAKTFAEKHPDLPKATLLSK